MIWQINSSVGTARSDRTQADGVLADETSAVCHVVDALIGEDGSGASG
jgi:hypothetical protein